MKVQLTVPKLEHNLRWTQAYFLNQLMLNTTDVLQKSNNTALKWVTGQSVSKALMEGVSRYQLTKQQLINEKEGSKLAFYKHPCRRQNLQEWVLHSYPTRDVWATKIRVLSQLQSRTNTTRLMEVVCWIGINRTTALGNYIIFIPDRNIVDYSYL